MAKNDSPILKELAKRRVLQELSRREFWQFCLYYDQDFFKKRAFFEDIAGAFQRIEDGEINSLSVSLPPRAGKSYITSLYCAWTLGRNPTESVMRNTCTATLYQKFSYDVRNIVKSDKFSEVFPNVKLSDDKANLQGWNTNESKMVGYFGAGVGGTIIGFGATKVAITDDLYRGMEDALSDTINDRVLQWKEATHDSRLESGCARIDIGTRWSVNDVIGRDYANGEYDESVIIPALDEDGNSFCEDVMTTEEYQKKKAKMLDEIWLAEYMQEPVDVKGRLFGSLDVVTGEDWAELSTRCEGYLAYIDVADQGKDYTAMAIGGIVKDHIYIVDVLFTRENTDITTPKCAALLDKYKVNYCRVESNSMGAMFSRGLQRATKTRVLQVSNTQNKITRIIMQSAFILNNISFVERDSKDHHNFIENMKKFSKEGKNKNDDAPDCMAGLSTFAQSMFKHW